MYGFGSRTGGLAGAGAAWGADGYASYANPAALAVRDGKRLHFSTGLLFMRPRFLPISGVVIDNDYTGDRAASNPLVGGVDVNYKDTVGQTIGLKLSLFPNGGNFSLGFSAFLPYQQTSYLDTGESFVPEYVLERARTQRLQFELGMGMRVFQGLHVGVGYHVALSVYGTAKTFLQSNGSKPSTLRFATSVKPAGSPVASLFYTSKGNEIHAGPNEGPEGPGHYTFGLVYRFATKSNAELDLKSSARALDTVAALNFRFTGISTMFYDPAALEFGSSWQVTEEWRAIAQMDYEMWSNYDQPSLRIINPVTDTCQESNGSCGVNFSEGVRFPQAFRNTLTPRFAHEFYLGDWTARAGYAYRQGILAEPPKGAGNVLDPSRHIFTGGFGVTMQEFVGLAAQHHLDVHFAYHSMVKQHATKTAGNETGNTASRKIGDPGYDVGGKAYGMGASLTFAF